MKSSWRAEYPFRSQFLNVSGGRMHYLDEGPQAGDADAATLLCVHGNPTWSFYWRKIVDGFRSRVRVVVPDHLGCGLSDKPQDYSYRLADHIGNLERLIESLDLRNITLLAHDWGGAIGLGAAGRMPERFRRLMLFNTAGYRSTRCPWRIRVCRIPLLGAWGVRGLNLFSLAALKMATEKPDRFTAAVSEGYIAPYDSYANRVAVHRFVQDIPLAADHPSYETLSDVERGLASLAHLPVHLIWGMKDWCFTPHFLERFLEFFPAADVHRFDDCGHYVVEDAIERILPIVEATLPAVTATSAGERR